MAISNILGNITGNISGNRLYTR